MTRVLVSAGVKRDFGDRLLAAGSTVEIVGVGREGDLDGPLEGFDVVFLSPDMFFGAATHVFRLIREAPPTWFHTSSAGVDHPAFKGLLEQGVRLTNGGGTQAKPIAQWVMLFMLAASKGLTAWLADKSERRWQPHECDELTGRVCGVIGLGAIGQEVARLAKAMEMKTIGVNRSAQPADCVDSVLSLDRIDELLNQSDYVVVCAPLNDQSRHLIDADRLKMMKPSAWLINIGRGAIIDEPALVHALQAGTIAGAALDVFEKEPLPDDSPLWEMPNVFISPHNSGSSPYGLERAVEVFALNLERFVRGEPLANEVLDDGVGARV